MTFFGFVRNLSLRRDADAKRVAFYGNLRRPTKQAIVESITVARSQGEIDAERYEELMDTIDRLWSRYQDSAQLVDTRDPKDWEAMPGGGHRRRDHVGRDEADYEARQIGAEGVRK
jgi:hypothetical protein